MKPTDEVKAPTATEVLDIQTLQEAYQHGLYALAAYGKGYAKGEAPDIGILIEAGFPDDGVEAEKLRKTHTILDQYDSWTGLSVVAIRNDVTGQVTVAPRGTEPATVADLLTDTLIALGVPEQLNPQYRALKDKMNAWMADGTLPDKFSIAGHSLGMYLAGSLMQDFGEHIIKGFGFNEPGSGGVWGDMVEVAGGRLAGHPNIYIFRPAGDPAVIGELGFSRGGYNIFLPTDTSGHGLRNSIWGNGSLSYFLQNPELLPQLPVQVQTEEEGATLHSAWAEICEKNVQELTDFLFLSTCSAKNLGTLFCAFLESGSNFFARSEFAKDCQN